MQNQVSHLLTRSQFKLNESRFSVQSLELPSHVEYRDGNPVLHNNNIKKSEKNGFQARKKQKTDVRRRVYQITKPLGDARLRQSRSSVTKINMEPGDLLTSVANSIITKEKLIEIQVKKKKEEARKELSQTYAMDSSIFLQKTQGMPYY